MFSNKKYQVYTIKCNKTEKIFVGITSGTKANMLNWLLKSSEQDPESYVNLKQSVKEHGLQNHVFSRHQDKIFNTKKEGEEYISKVQTALCKKDLLLNDNVVNPETYTCLHCGKTLKVVYRQVHDDNYCSSRTMKFLDSIMEDLIPE
jgi:hypothetical protein